MSDGRSDSRPRPRYGEYATPQEQAENVAKSMPPVSPLLVPHGESVPAPSGLVRPESPEKFSLAPPSADRSAALPAKPRRRRWDLAVTVALLAYGLVTVLAGFAQYSDLPALIDQVYETQSVGTFTPTDLATNAGTVIVLTNVVLYALTAWVTVRRLMAARIAFWVPLTGGALALLVMMVVVGVVIANDPAFIDYLDGMSPGA